MGFCREIFSFLGNHLLICFLIGGAIIGIIVGVVLKSVRSEPYTSREIMYVGFPGEILIQMLKGIAVPLMIAWLISSISSLESNISRAIVCQFTMYILLMKVLSACMAITFGIVAHPGSNLDQEASSVWEIKKDLTFVDIFLDLIRNLFPTNIVGMTVRQYQTVLINPNDSTVDINNWDVQRGGIFIEVVNLLGIVIVSIVIGIALVCIGQKGESMVKVFKCLSKATLVITYWIIRVAPFCIIFLIARQIMRTDNHGDLMMKLGIYTSVYIALLVIEGVVLYPLIYFLLVHKNPFSFMANFSKALVTALATSSSNATLPVSMQCMIDKNRIDSRLVQFVMPIGAAINKDGSVIYQALSVIFIANLNEKNLAFGDLIAVSMTCTVASIAGAGTPFTGVVTLVVVLDALGLPVNGVSLLVALDWIFDRFRTVINVLGDAIGAGILAKFHAEFLTGPSEDINPEDRENEEEKKEA